MRCLYLLNGDHWVHYSRRLHKVIVRGFRSAADKQEYSLPDTAHDVWLAELENGARKVSVKKALAQLKAQGHQGDLTADWHKTLDLLNQSKWVPPGIPSVPWTPLKDFYLSLRQANQLAHHEAHARNILAAHADAPDLPRLFQQSAAQMEPYQNLLDPLWPPERQWAQVHEGPLTPDRLATLLDPKRWTPGRAQWSPPHEDLAFRPVGREVGPLRTRQAVHDNGTTGRFAGQGGMDLLLRSDDAEKLPIVGEIKDAGDTNLFFALVQALRYAVELTTLHQFQRLRQFHAEEFGDLRTGCPPRCDVYLLCLGDEPHRLHQSAADIADKLLARADQPVARKIRRIAFIQAQLDGDNLRCKATHVSAVPAAP